jgi:hypothetical protein
MSKEFEQVKATLGVEGLTPSKEAEKVCEMYFKGTITSEKAIEKIKRMYGII